MPSLKYPVTDIANVAGLPQLPIGWNWARFSDVCERVSVGHVGPTTEFFCERGNGGVPLIRSQDVRPGRLMLGQAAHITPEFHAKARKSQLRAGDVLIVRVGANRGDCCSVPEGVGDLNCANIVFARPKQRGAFFAQFFRSPLGQQMLLSATTGSAQGVINTGSVASMAVPVPPLAVQGRIAGVVSAYDDLIENCERRIRVLDDMARSLYREWFVLFRYPGHEKTPLVDSALGRIPKGWTHGPIREIYSGLFDGPHATPAPATEGPIFLGIGNMTESGRLDLSSVRHIAEADFDRWTKRVTPQAGDIVFTYEATLHRYALIPDDFRGCLGRRLALIRVDPARKCSCFLFLTLLSEAWHEVVSKNTLSGATVDRIPLSKLPEFPIIRPPMPLVAHFEDAVQPIIDDQTRLSKLIVNLRRTRDLLLPRLLSGQLAVEDAA